MTTVKIHEGNILTVLVAGSFALLLLLAAAGLVFGSVRFAGSVLAGGLLAIGNFCWLKNVLVRSFRLDSHHAPRFALVRYVVRLAVLALAISFLIIFCHIDILGLLIGLSVLVLNIIALALYLISAKGD